MPDINTKDVGLGGIGIKPERLRALRPDTVKQLMESMSVNGLLQPILLRPKQTAGYWLVAGRHRFVAAEKLKWKSIRASILTGIDADHAELAEIDENLIRADLSPAETALHIDARKPLYEKLNPLTKHGGDRKSKKAQSSSQNENLKAFVNDTAQKTGKGRSTVGRDATRGKKGRAWLRDITQTSLDEGAEIDALIKLHDVAPDKAGDLIEKAKAGEDVSAKTALKQVNRANKETELAAKIVALPQKKFGVILADPEWQFEPWSRITGMDRAADNHYPTSLTSVIAARDVPSIAADDCALFLCATAPMLRHAFVVMEAWGFDYKTNWELHKDRIITGYWNRNKHEHLLLGVRGDIPCPAPGEQWDSVIDMVVGRHSAKPEAICEMIEAYFPRLPKIELNRRGPPRPGWDAWGNETELPQAAE